MPKKLDVKEYLQKLASDVGLLPEQVEPLLTVLDAKPEFGTALRKDILAKSEFSQKMDELREQAEALNAEKQRWTDWYEKDAKPTYAKSKQEAEERLNLIRKYEQLYGPIGGQQTGNPTPQQQSVSNLTKEEVQELIDQNNQGLTVGLSGLTKSLYSAGMQHFATFGEKLDLNELEKFCVDNKITDAEAGWQAMHADRLDEIKTKKEQERIDKLVQEGLRKERAKHNLPTDPQPEAKIPLFEKPREREAEPSVSRNERFSAFQAAMDNNKHLLDEPDPVL